MLDLARLDRIELSAKPIVQRLVGTLVLAPNYDLPPRVRIEFEGVNNVPDEPVIFAMNHTDRFNYWPLQYALWRRRGRYTATWVKGKYYETPVVGFFMEMTNNIPTVSRGYLITKDFIKCLGRRPSNAEYTAVRAWVNAVSRGESVPPPAEAPREILERPRDILGVRFYPQRESYAAAIDGLFRRMMRRFVELNEEAAELGLDLLIFPEGTRSVRLSKGRPGLAQIAMHLERTVVPVGCNGTDLIYPGSSPFARSGRAVYRFGAPVRPEDSVAWVDRGTFAPFTAEAEREHQKAFQAYVDDIIERIDPLLDERYQFGVTPDSESVVGSDRFV